MIDAESTLYEGLPEADGSRGEARVARRAIEASETWSATPTWWRPSVSSSTSGPSPRAPSTAWGPFNPRRAGWSVRPAKIPDGREHQRLVYCPRPDDPGVARWAYHSAVSGSPSGSGADERLGEQARRNTRARFEQWAQNPTCQANTISAVHNVRMADVAKHEGYKSTFGQSPFAIARGTTFERLLLRNGGARLLEALIEKDVLPPGATGLEDFRIRMNYGPEKDLESAMEATLGLLRRVAGTAAGSVPALVAGATVRIPRGVMLPEAVLILDALAIRTDGDLPELIVGEVKTYPDRGGHTDPHELALARAQAGLYVHALQMVVRQLEVADRVRVGTDGFLVLTRPGSNMPAVRAGEDLRFQAERARRGFELLEKAALGLPPFDPVGDDPIAAVINARIDYSEACVAFCDRAPKCSEDVLAAGDSAVLGDEVARFLGSISLPRALELLNGAKPDTTAEEDLTRRIAETDWMVAR